ncbi:MAG: putative lipid II flippase FtsW [Actinomycetota bacterium]|nr:putative lipid II flippase FtsW [Actinomycetota bacterium]
MASAPAVASVAGPQLEKTAGEGDSARRPARASPPLEHRILMTATLCLMAFGAVMVYSASSPSDLLAGTGNGTGELVRYLIFGAVGLAAMHVLARRGMALLSRRVVNLLLLGSFALLVLVLVPGFGVEVNGARRWFAAGPIQFQPSELMKLALLLYAARHLAEHPAERLGGRSKHRNARGARSFRQALGPVAVLVGPACLLIVVEPDLGTALVVAFAVASLLIAAGMPMRYLAALVVCGAVIVGLLIVAQPYQRARLTSFLHPWASTTKAGAGYQAVQGQIALGSGGLLGVGLGRSVQKIFYLPEAQTDFILAVIGEELGVLGIFGVVFLYGMIAYAGLRTARRAVGRHAKLLATGLTSLILCQGILNIFVVLGLAPLTGVPLPFISYAPSNLCVMLAAVGLLLNIAGPGARRLRAVEARGLERPRVKRERPRPERREGAGDKPAERSEDRDRRGRDRRPRRAGAGGRGRPAR